VKIDISRVSKPKNPSAIFFYYRCLLAAQLDQNQSINRNVLLSLSEENQNWWIKELYYLATGRNLTVKISNGRNLKSQISSIDFCQFWRKFWPENFRKSWEQQDLRLRRLYSRTGSDNLKIRVYVLLSKSKRNRNRLSMGMALELLPS